MKELVKKIRELTGAGFLECKKAAEESNGDFNKAMEILKAKGIEKAANKTSNAVEHGSVVIKSLEGDIVVLNFQAQTDFAVKSDAFCSFVENEANLWLNSSVDSLNLVKNEKGESFQDRLSFFISTLGENVVLRDGKKFIKQSNKKYVHYMHNKINSKFSDIALLGVMIEVNESADDGIALSIAKHAAASDALVLSEDLITEEMKVSNPDINEYVLLNQNYFFDDSVTVKNFALANNVEIFNFQVFKG